MRQDDVQKTIHNDTDLVSMRVYLSQSNAEALIQDSVSYSTNAELKKEICA